MSRADEQAPFGPNAKSIQSAIHSLVKDKAHAVEFVFGKSAKFSANGDFGFVGCLAARRGRVGVRDARCDIARASAEWQRRFEGNSPEYIRGEGE